MNLVVCLSLRSYNTVATAPLFLSHIEPTYRSNSLLYYVNISSACSVRRGAG